MKNNNFDYTKKTIMKARLNIQQLAPDAYNIVLELAGYIENSGVEKKHSELIKIRSSQINGCAFCINMHTKDALNHGETNQRIFMLNAWREVNLYTPQERVILAMTEEITLISEKGLTDETYQQAQELFTQDYIAKIILAISTINVWNRISVSSRTQV